MASFILLTSIAMPTTEDSRSAPTIAMRRKLLSQGTSYCYLNQSGSLITDEAYISIGCGEEPLDAPTCTIGAGAATCFLGDNRNGVDANRWYDSYAFDHCEDVQVFVDPDETQRYYCRRLITTGDWSTRRRAMAGVGAPETTGDSWWGCGWPWQSTGWHDDACRSVPRFLGEACWDDSGECDNSNVPAYDGLHLSCATVPELGINTPTCVPSAFEIQRNTCDCGWFDWYFFVACGAGGGVCNGHPCVMSTGDGSYTCDYQANNDW